ncbi:uncharacterized protein LOC144152335 [Haemaphysalis longicornis]
MVYALPILSIALKLLFGAGAVQGALGPNKLEREVPDAAKIFAALDHPIGARDTDLDVILRCLSAQRTYFDPESSNATYVWSLKQVIGNGRDYATLHHMLGDTPDRTNYTVGSSTKVEVGIFHYTDYANCAVLEMHHFGNQCTLWVTKDVLDAIPEECLRQHEDICGYNTVSLYSTNECKNSDV